MEGGYKESQSQEVQVGIHKNAFNLISILLCETCSTHGHRRTRDIRSAWLLGKAVFQYVGERERASYQTAAESKQHLACGSRIAVFPERLSRRRWSEEAPWRYCWSPTHTNKHQNTFVSSLKKHLFFFHMNELLRYLFRHTLIFWFHAS